jgi:hypothetical protein
MIDTREVPSYRSTLSCARKWCCVARRLAAWIIRETLRQVDADIMQPQRMPMVIGTDGNGERQRRDGMRSASHMKAAARQFRLLDLSSFSKAIMESPACLFRTTTGTPVGVSHNQVTGS